MKKAIFTETSFIEYEPKALEVLDSISFYFNWDVSPSQKEVDGKMVDGWSCKTLYVEGECSSAECVRAWLSVFYPQDIELKLINDFNSGIKEEYNKYIEDRLNIKRIIKQAFDESRQ